MPYPSSSLPALLTKVPIQTFGKTPFLSPRTKIVFLISSARCVFPLPFSFSSAHSNRPSLLQRLAPKRMKRCTSRLTLTLPVLTAVVAAVAVVVAIGPVVWVVATVFPVLPLPRSTPPASMLVIRPPSHPLLDLPFSKKLGQSVSVLSLLFHYLASMKLIVLIAYDFTPTGCCRFIYLSQDSAATV